MLCSDWQNIRNFNTSIFLNYLNIYFEFKNCFDLSKFSYFIIRRVFFCHLDDSTDSQATCYPLLTDADASVSSKESREEIFGGDFLDQKSDVFYDVFKDYSMEDQKAEREVYVNEIYRSEGLFDADKMYPCTK